MHQEISYQNQLWTPVSKRKGNYKTPRTYEGRKLRRTAFCLSSKLLWRLASMQLENLNPFFNFKVIRPNMEYHSIATDQQKGNPPKKFQTFLESNCIYDKNAQFWTFSCISNAIFSANRSKCYIFNHFSANRSSASSWTFPSSFLNWRIHSAWSMRKKKHWDSSQKLDKY